MEKFASKDEYYLSKIRTLRDENNNLVEKVEEYKEMLYKMSEEDLAKYGLVKMEFKKYE